MASEKILFVEAPQSIVFEHVDTNFAISRWKDSEMEVEQEDLQKCGDIFLTNHGRLTFACSKCNWIFLDLPSFADHIGQECGFGTCPSRSGDYRCLTPVHDIGGLKNSDSGKLIDDNIEGFDFFKPCKDNDDAKNQMANEDTIESLEPNFLSLSPENEISSRECSISICDLEIGTIGDENDSEQSNSNDFKVAKTKRGKPFKFGLKVEDLSFCAACNKNFTKGFRVHLKNKHSDIVSKEEIKIDSIQSLENKIANSLDTMECIFCNLVFTGIEKFRQHSAMHLGRNMYVCKFCPKKFGSQYNRRVHMNTHADVRPFQCVHCSKGFNTPHNLQKHIEWHRGELKFECQFCDKRLATNAEKRVHERRHNKEKPFQCEVCADRFLTETLLRYHKLRHQGIKNFKCKFCKKKFYSMPLLKEHMPTHTGEKKFKCEICNEKFRRPNALRQHKLLHEKEKKYACSICGKEFAQYAGLYSHRKIHGENLK